ncbi:MAG: hypothetical protein HUU35_15255, partial [Armatimonadetes bacterium]|nr:hypothetical protein [Armatimonadota bacterium]
EEGGSLTIIAPTLVPADPRLTVFGQFADQSPSHAVARTPRGTVVQFAGPLHPQVLHNLAVEAGLRTLGTPGQVVYVGCGVAVAHRVQPGPLQVHFESPVDLYATDGQTVVARGVTLWEPKVELLETAAVLYQPSP